MRTHSYMIRIYMCSTQTTLGKALAGMLAVPHVSLDALCWQPGWRETPTPEFQEKVRKALDQDPRGWVVDGNYTKKLGEVIEDKSTDIICAVDCVANVPWFLIIHAG